MTGKEALNKLEEGYTLRRKAWNPETKCKAYFSDNKKAAQYVPESPEFADFISIYDALDSGDFFEDDWEIVDEIC